MEPIFTLSFAMKAVDACACVSGAERFGTHIKRSNTPLTLSEADQRLRSGCADAKRLPSRKERSLQLLHAFRRLTQQELRRPCTNVGTHPGWQF